MITWVVTGWVFSRIWKYVTFNVVAILKTEVIDNVRRSLQNDQALGCRLTVICFRRRYLWLDIHVGGVWPIIIILVFQRILSTCQTMAVLSAIEYLYCRVFSIWCNLITLREEIFRYRHVLWSAILIHRLIWGRDCAMLIWVFVFWPFRILVNLLLSDGFDLFIEPSMVLWLILHISFS